MSHCPSHDWDRYVDELDRAAEEQAFIEQANADAAWRTEASKLLEEIREDMEYLQRSHSLDFSAFIKDISSLLRRPRDEDHCA